MMKDNILLAQGGKNKIFIFDAYGKLFKIIDVSLCDNDTDCKISSPLI